MINKKFIGSKIKSARCNMDITQEKLAEAVGLSTNYLSKVERGLNSPSAEVLLKIIEVLGLSLEDFGIFRDENIEYSKRKILHKIVECDNSTIKAVEPIIDVVIESFQNLNTK